VAVPIGLGLSYVVDRRRVQPSGPEDVEAPSALRSLAVVGGLVGSLAGGAFGEHRLADLIGGRLDHLLPVPPAAGRVAGHGAFLAGLGVGVSTTWHRARHGIEVGTTADAPVVEPTPRWWRWTRRSGGWSRP
jgi:hypothetical protein